MTTDNDQLFLALGRLEGKVDSLLALKQKLENQLDAQDSRLRDLEHSRGILIGIAAAAGAAVSAIVSFFVKLTGTPS
jgi:HAMP domain-containing protein